jgi:hypothetical protein
MPAKEGLMKLSITIFIVNGSSKVTNGHNNYNCDRFCKIKAYRNKKSQKKTHNSSFLKFSKTSHNVTALRRPKTEKQMVTMRYLGL